METLTAEFQWAGIKIELTYKPEWSKVCGGTSHLEIRSIDPEKARLPITETGYRSHFFHAEETMARGELIDLVKGWLDEKAQGKEWLAYQAESQQLKLDF